MSDAPYFYTWSAQAGAEGVAITGGSGSSFTTADGAVWLDMGALTYHINAGHGHPYIIEAIKKQADALCISMPSADYPVKRRLAERLLELAGPRYSKVFFTLGGSEAIENAIKMARMFTGRYKLISRYRSYHGASMGAVSLGGDYRRPPVEPGLPGVIHALDCYCARCPFGKTLDTCETECAKHVGDLLELEGPGTVAAVFMEPVVGANGVLVPPATYWPMVREACTRHGALLVADEVLTGFGRTGAWFAHQHYGVEPDLITCAKGLTSGYGTLGAVIVHERVAAHFEQNVLYAGLTSYAHPLGCAAAMAALEVYEDEGMIDNAATLEAPLLEALRGWAARWPDNVLHPRGKGLLAGVEIASTPVQWDAMKAAIADQRVYVHVRKKNDMIILSPPLCITREQLHSGLGRIEAALSVVFDGD